MQLKPPKLYFFLDQNIPDSVGRYLQRRGHSVLRLRFHIPDNSPDPTVAMTALKAGRILVTWDKDFNSQRFRQERYALLNRISLSGDGPTLLIAIKEHIDMIEFRMTKLKKGERVVHHVRVGNLRIRSD